VGNGINPDGALEGRITVRPSTLVVEIDAGFFVSDVSGTACSRSTRAGSTTC
jgi:hypothetical protein